MAKPGFLTTKPTCTNDTVRAYLKRGFVLLARAHVIMTGPGDVIDAFHTLFNDPDLVYRPATTRLYQQQIKAVIARKLSDGEINRERAISGFADIKALLLARRGPCPKRTSRAKLKAATYAEFRKITADFARRARLPAGLDRTDTVLSCMVKVGPFTGLRPYEWLRATITDHKLRVVNAKSANGRALGEVREISLGGLPPKIVKLVSLLIRQLPLLFAEAGNDWRKILGRLGERLARVCARIGLPRWSLYTTRHVAIASWKRAGLSDAEIAALTGHSSTRTARQHYAGGRHGWTAEFACARPDPDIVAAIVAHNGVMTSPGSERGKSMSVGSASGPTTTDKLGASALPAATPHSVIASERQYEAVQFVPILKAEVMTTLSRIDPVEEADEVPAFSMG
jgi:integrase